VILLQLINNNPYVTLQVLEDDDIVRNEIIVKLLDKLRKDTTKEASSLLPEIKKNIINRYHIEQTKDIINEIESLLQEQTFLESYEAICLMQKEYKWKTRNDATFTSTILDFESKEQKAFDKREELVKQAQLLELRKKRKEAFEEGCRLYYSREYEEAVKCYDNAIKLGPYDFDDKDFCEAIEKKEAILAILGKLKEVLEDYEIAIKHCDIAIKINPDNPNPYLQKGEYLFQLDMWTEAIEAYNAVIILDKSKADWSLYIRQARCFKYLGKYTEAIKCYETALKLDPSSKKGILPVINELKMEISKR
jgi:tetratricopeptide (TPR) repeat protein